MPAPKKLDTKLENLKEEKDDQVQLAAGLAKSSDEQDSETRQQVAKMFVRFYFAGLIIILIGVPFYNYLAFARAGDNRLLLDLKDTLLAYQAVVGTLVGAVIAYYFRNKFEKQTD